LLTKAQPETVCLVSFRAISATKSRITTRMNHWEVPAVISVDLASLVALPMTSGCWEKNWPAAQVFCFTRAGLRCSSMTGFLKFRFYCNTFTGIPRAFLNIRSVNIRGPVTKKVLLHGALRRSKKTVVPH